MTKNKEKLNLPETLQLEVSEIGNDGEVLARPTEARFAAVGSFYVLPNSRIRPPLVPGDRFLARISGKKRRLYGKTDGSYRFCAATGGKAIRRGRKTRRAVFYRFGGKVQTHGHVA